MKTPLLSLLCALILSVSVQTAKATELSTCTSALPTITGMNTICGSGSIAISVSGEAIQYLYATSAGGLALTTSSGIVLNTPVLTANTAFWVAGYNGSCESERVKLIASLIKRPLQPTITGISTICGAGSIQIRVSSEFENIWYSSSVGGVALDTTGAVFQTPTITGVVSYWVSGYNGNKGCESGRVKVVAETFKKPDFVIFRKSGGFAGSVFYQSFYYLSNSRNWNLIIVQSTKKNTEVGSFNNTNKMTYFLDYNEPFPGNGGDTTKVIGADSLRLSVAMRELKDTIKVFSLNYNGCKSDTNYIFIDFTPPSVTGIVETLFNEASIYPNPNNGSFKITTQLPIEKITLYSSDGRKEEKDYTITKQIETGFKGLVLVEILANGKLYYEKVLVE